MKKRVAWFGWSWRLKSGALGFYVDGTDRVLALAGRSATSFGRFRPRGRAVAGLGMLCLGLPVALVMAERVSSSRVATSTGIVEGRPVGEVASLEGSLERYYSNREIAVTVSVSGYTSRIEETDSTPFITAANTATRPGVLALSRDLLKRYTPGAPFDFGDVVHLHGIGDFVVEDSMARRWEKRADIWFASLDHAREFGRRRATLTGPYGVAEDDARAAALASVRTGASR